MQLEHVELDSCIKPELISSPVNAGLAGNGAERHIHSKRAELNLTLNHIEKKYSVLVSEIRERNERSFMISPPVKGRRGQERSFVVHKYSNEHMMRNFARYLNRGRLSRKNIDETIYEMKSLQEFCT